MKEARHKSAHTVFVTSVKYKSKTAGSQDEAYPCEGKRSDWKEGKGDFSGVDNVLSFESGY